MKTFLWILVSLSVTALAFWIVTGPWYPKTPSWLVLTSVFFALPSIGSVWMLWVAIRYEKHPLAIVLIAMLPYMFLWYYFERFRPRRITVRAERLG